MRVMRYLPGIISAAAALALFACGAYARNFSCMESAYQGAHQILSREQYQTCISVNFPALKADKADYEAQAAKFRALRAEAEAYRPAAQAEDAPDEVSADAALINLPAHEPDLSACESQAAREVMIETAPLLPGLDKGIAYYNSARKTLLFKRGKIYAAYLPLCGALKLVLMGDADLAPYKAMAAAAHDGGL